jgi:cyclic beta-1,2-glucan synthetase
VVKVDEAPLRAELFNAEQMDQHAQALAGSHIVSTARTAEQLLSRLAENESVLIAAHALLAEALQENHRATPAGEWLLDNFYLIEEQIRTARRHFPKGYSRALPRLANGPSAGLPRVYDIVLETISHTDGRLDPDGLRRFLASYQTVTPLKLGELWAIPIMARLALIENLRRVSARSSAARADRNSADYWADKMTAIVEVDPNGLILLIADMARSDPPMVSAFVAEFSRRLQGQSPALALPLTWMEQRLSQSNLTIDQLVQSENQQQAANQVSMSNSIGSLRLLGAMNWRDFVEDLSAVEQIFRANPDGTHAKMDFATRDRYRQSVEKLAKRCALSETDVAAAAMPEDAGLLAAAEYGIAELNQKYRSPSPDPFFLFHRPRVWESRDKIWMGYERKRGKLAALNALLRPPLGLEEKNVFTSVVGDSSVLPSIKYVITLDTDT